MFGFDKEEKLLKAISKIFSDYSREAAKKHDISYINTPEFQSEVNSVCLPKVLVLCNNDFELAKKLLLKARDIV